MRTRSFPLDDHQFTLITKALADPKRFEMLQRIARQGSVPTCTYLRESLQLAPATISHHLRELETAGLVQVQREGKFARITLRRDVWKAYVKRLSNI